jgi:uncharacterized membrane protein YgcG
MLTRILLAVLLLAGASLPAHAVERILSFVSDVTVERNGDLRVKETIRVQAEGREIRRGILRDFPTIYTNKDGRRVEIGFDVESVMRDGAPEQYTRETLNNGVRLRIGRSDVLLPIGTHDYVISYRTSRQIGYFDSFDELYWNATGNGWTFTIELAEARITLPEKVPFRQTAFYTGPQGARGTDATVWEQEPGRIVFRTTRALPPKNGLTVAAAWEKGVVLPPSAGRRAQWWLFDNLPLAGGALALALVLGYYARTWWRVGRDPQRGTIIPLFEPPAGMSAAAVRYVWRMGFDDRAFAAAVLELGVRGHLRLVDQDGQMQVEHRKGGKEIGRAERDMKAKLFRSGDALLMDNANHAAFGSAKNALKSALVRAYHGKLFNENTGAAAYGMLVWLLATALIAVSLFIANRMEPLAVMVFGTLFAGAGLVTWTIALRSMLRNGFRWVWLLVLAIMSVFVFFGISALAAGTGTWLEFAVVLVPCATLVLVALGYGLMQAATPEGRKVMDQIEGLRQYLGVAEEERLEFMHPPEKTPELFERFLPYAVALDVENTWAKRFAGVLAAAAAAAVAAGTMNDWYQGNPSTLSDPGTFADRLGSDLSQTIAAASSPPGSSGGGDSSGSSSGSSGGGDSGGGGGGGGGSGW